MNQPAPSMSLRFDHGAELIENYEMLNFKEHGRVFLNFSISLPYQQTSAIYNLIKSMSII